MVNDNGNERRSDFTRSYDFVLATEAGAARAILCTFKPRGFCAAASQFNALDCFRVTQMYRY